MRMGRTRRGSRNTLRRSREDRECGSMWALTPTRLIRSEMFRLPYVKYSTGTNLTICIIYRAMRKPDSTVARRAFGLWTGEGYTQNVTTRLFARKRYRTRPVPLFCILFLARQEWDQTANQRSVCCLERTSSAMDETCRLRRGEGYEACEDECPRSDSCGDTATTALR